MSLLSREEASSSCTQPLSRITSASSFRHSSTPEKLVNMFRHNDRLEPNPSLIHGQEVIVLEHFHSACGAENSCDVVFVPPQLRGPVALDPS